MRPNASSQRTPRTPRENAENAAAETSSIIRVAVKEILELAGNSATKKADHVARLDVQFTLRGTKYEDFMRWFTIPQRWSRYAKSGGGRILRSELKAALSDYYEGEKIDVEATGAAFRDCEHDDVEMPYQELFARLSEAPSDVEFLKSFLRWLIPRWDQFFGNFQPDGTMAWKDFRRFVHMENKWRGSAERAFKILGEGDGVVHASACTSAKRWFYHGADKNDVSIEDCRRIFTRYYESLGRAWRMALDPHDTGFCCFHGFCKKSQEVGVRRNLNTIWADLTHGFVERPIRYRDFDPHGDRLLSYFAASLAKLGGNLRNGWDRMCNSMGGKVKLAGFTDFCNNMRIDAIAARRLFAILDPLRPEPQRYLSTCDMLAFLSHWDPGKVQSRDLDPYQSMSDLKLAASLRLDLDLQTEKRNTFDDPTPVHPFTVMANRETYEITLVLSAEEHQEYLRRLRCRMEIGGAALTPRTPRTPRAKVVPKAPMLKSPRLSETLKISADRIALFEDSLFEHLKRGADLNFVKPVSLTASTSTPTLRSDSPVVSTISGVDLDFVKPVSLTTTASTPTLRSESPAVGTKVSEMLYRKPSPQSRSPKAQRPSVFELAVAGLPC